MLFVMGIVLEEVFVLLCILFGLMNIVDEIDVFFGVFVEEFVKLCKVVEVLV